MRRPLLVGGETFYATVYEDHPAPGAWEETEVFLFDGFKLFAESLTKKKIIRSEQSAGHGQNIKKREGWTAEKKKRK